MPDPAERSPIAHEPISVVLLARDDESEIEDAAGAWSSYLQNLQRPYELLIVNAGSTDQACQRAEVVLAQEPNARVLSPEPLAGAGAALRTALAAARFPLFFCANVTRSCSPAALDELLKLIDQVDLVSGYRASGERALKLAPADRLYAWYVRLLFGVRLKDVDCPFKLFRREIFARIPIQSDGPFVHAEIVAKANFLGCLMAEAPVNWVPPVLGSAPPALRKLRRAESWQIFRHPEFGPASVASSVAGGASTSASSSAPQGDVSASHDSAAEPLP
jgi:glycosyltransferase involved in cell wall biosynthesis